MVTPLRMLATHDADGVSVVRPWGLIVGRKRVERWAAPEGAASGLTPSDGSDEWEVMDQLMWCNHVAPTARTAASLLTRIAASKGILRGGGAGAVSAGAARIAAGDSGGGGFSGSSALSAGYDDPADPYAAAEAETVGGSGGGGDGVSASLKLPHILLVDEDELIDPGALRDELRRMWALRYEDELVVAAAMGPGNPLMDRACTKVYHADGVGGVVRGATKATPLVAAQPPPGYSEVGGLYSCVE